jgi:hypothetical protein
VARAVPADLPLHVLDGDTRPLGEWTTTFHLALVVLDPYTYESSWILDTAGRVLRTFAESDCRTAFLVASDDDDARRFMGPWAQELLVFTDDERTLVKGLGLEGLPAFVHLNMSNEVEASAEGWDPDEWREVAEELADTMSWRRPTIPVPEDPVPFAPTPALG